jgi:GAF domain-containing protein
MELIWQILVGLIISCLIGDLGRRYFAQKRLRSLVELRTRELEEANQGLRLERDKRMLAEANKNATDARLESLLRIAQYPVSGVQELLDFALNESITLTGSKLGYIYLYDEGRHEFVLNTWSKEVMKECTILAPETVYQLEKTGVWGDAVRFRKPVVMNDFKMPSPRKKGYPEGHVALHRFLTIPVFSEDRIVAVVGVANKASDYDSLDITQLTLLMDAVWKISDRKRAESALREKTEMLDSFFKGASAIRCG